MKYAEVTPTHKKDNKTEKENYCPVSILPNLSKVYERLMYNQIYPYFQTIFSKYLSNIITQISAWVSERFYCTALSLSNGRKMAQNSR